MDGRSHPIRGDDLVRRPRPGRRGPRGSRREALRPAAALAGRVHRLRRGRDPPEATSGSPPPRRDGAIDAGSRSAVDVPRDARAVRAHGARGEGEGREGGRPRGDEVLRDRRHAPARVLEIHAAFVGAGARLVLTNTFGANRYRLERYGLAERVTELCGAGVALARDAGAPLVAGSMGPLGVRLQPYGRVRPEDAFAAYREQAAALAAAGVDLLVVETQSDLRELEQGVRAAREAAPNVALVASATFTRDDRTLLGSTPEEVAHTVVGLGVEALGVNCGEGPAQILRIVRAMRPAASA